MKNYFKYLLFTSAVIFTQSCENELSQLSSTQIPLDVAMNGSSTANFSQAVDGAYAAFKGSGFLSTASDTGNLLGVPDLLTDNLILNPEGRISNAAAYNWNITANNGSVTGAYTQAYFAISRANIPLKFIENLPSGTFRTNIEAQARGIRGALHFDIVRLYAKIPTQSSDALSSLGIAYVDEFSPSSANFTRSLTVDQTYQKIEQDLLFAYNNITENSVGRLNKNAIAGILSRVYLFWGKYDSAIQYGNIAIAASPSVGTLANFKNIWQATNNDGVLFKILNSAQENVTSGVVFQQGATATAGNIRSEYVVPKSLYDRYITTDIRKSSYFRQSTYSGGGGLRNHVIKYAFNNVTSLNVAEIKYLRTAEVYLNVAEAALRKPVKDEALANQLLNTLKTQRYTGYANVTLTGQALLDEVMLQRRLELAFENDRFYTFKRLGLALQRTGEGANVDGTGTASTVQAIPSNDYRWQWPIPQNAININSAIVQNPGY